MIRITVDTEEELNIVRRVLLTDSCSHNNCQGKYTSRCNECVEKYCENKVALYKKETVEIPQKVVV